MWDSFRGRFRLPTQPGNKAGPAGSPQLRHLHWQAGEVPSIGLEVGTARRSLQASLQR